jgi:hypothetical protein
MLRGNHAQDFFLKGQWHENICIVIANLLLIRNSGTDSKSSIHLINTFQKVVDSRQHLMQGLNVPNDGYNN